MNWYQLAKSASAIPEISENEAAVRNLFGPVYHGTLMANQAKIDEDGFQVFIDRPRKGNVSHGYENGNYAANLPPPIHHLGYGVYFTTVKAIAAQFAYARSVSGMPVYYLDVPRLETINFGSPNTMMKWWIANGYNLVPEFARDEDFRVAATIHMTNQLKAKYDAVWYRGQGVRRLLDGDQICVYEPAGKIFKLNRKLAKPGEIGSLVRRKSDGMIGEIRKVEGIESRRMEFIQDFRRENPEEAAKHYPEGLKCFYRVKWRKGGTDYNVRDTDVELL